MTPSDRDNAELARINKQLEDIKRLMIMQLLAAGVQSTQIAKSLGVAKSTISGMVPVREIQTAVKRNRRAAETDG